MDVRKKGVVLIAHVSKYSRGALGHMLKHYHREKDADGNYIKFKNQSIDTDLTYLNKDLIERDITDLECIHRRMEEVVYQDRKDLNVMASWILTAPDELRFTDQEKEMLRDNDGYSEELKEKMGRLEEFFQASFEVLSKRYDEKNVINCSIHYDETSPHMHFAFMPIIMDKKKIRGTDEYIEVEKLNAKKCLSKTELSVFHKEVQLELDKRLSFKVKLHEEIEIVNEETGEIEKTSPTKLKGNRSINQLKKENVILEYENKKLVADKDSLIEEMRYEKRLTDSYIASQERSLSKIAEDAKILIHTYKAVEDKAVSVMNDVASIEVPIQEVNQILKLQKKEIRPEVDSKGNKVINKKGNALLKVLFTADGWEMLSKAITKIFTFFKNFQNVIGRDYIVDKAQRKVIDEKPKSIIEELAKYKKRSQEYNKNMEERRRIKAKERKEELSL